MSTTLEIKAFELINTHIYTLSNWRPLWIMRWSMHMPCNQAYLIPGHSNKLLAKTMDTDTLV